MWSLRSRPGKGREGRCGWLWPAGDPDGARAPHPPRVWLPWALFPAAYVLESGGKERRAGPHRVFTGVRFPRNTPAAPRPERLPGVQEHRGPPWGPVTTALVLESGSLMSYGIQRDPIRALTKTSERLLPGFQACPSNQGQHRPPGGFVLPGTEGGEGGDREVAPGPGLSRHCGGPQGSRSELSSLSHGIFCLKDANNSFLLFCDDNQRSFIFFESILSPCLSTPPTYMQRR